MVFETNSWKANINSLDTVNSTLGKAETENHVTTKKLRCLPPPVWKLLYSYNVSTTCQKWGGSKIRDSEPQDFIKIVFYYGPGYNKGKGVLCWTEKNHNCFKLPLFHRSCLFFKIFQNLEARQQGDVMPSVKPKSPAHRTHWKLCETQWKLKNVVTLTLRLPRGKVKSDIKWAQTATCCCCENQH